MTNEPARTSEPASGSAADIQQYLSGVAYPTNRAGLLQKAEQNGASQEVLKTLETLPIDDFGEFQDVVNALGWRNALIT